MNPYAASADVIIAAANTPEEKKKFATVFCTGKNDELVINSAIESLTRGGTIRLLDGDYNIDSFPGEDHSAIFLGFNEGRARTITIIGDTENKAYNTRYGVVIHVTKEAADQIDPAETYRVFHGTAKKPEAEGDFYTYTHVNNLNLENFYLMFQDVSKPFIGVDAVNFGCFYGRQLGIYSDRYFPDRFLHLKPATACKGTIGFSSCPSSSDEMSRCGLDLVQIGGLHTGFRFCGMDHVIMHTCMAARCCWGYVFNRMAKTLTMINCADEGNTHLPYFLGTGEITNIDFNIERFNSAFIPDDPEGNNEPMQASEEQPGGWKGFISYTLQGKAFGGKPFWKEGHGRNFVTVNEKHSRTERPENPEYLETYFDTKTDKTLTWNGTTWVDAMGNAVR